MMAPRGPGFARIIVVTVVAALLLTVLVAGCAETPDDMEAPPPDDAALAPEPMDDGAAESQAAEGQPEEDEAAPAEEESAAEDAAAGDEQQSAAEEGTDAVKTVVKIKTGKGDILAELYDEKMPITAGNFLLLIDKGFYKNMTFHRVVPDFVIQGGDPTGTGLGDPGWSIPLEKPGEIHHERGILSMARAMDPDSAGSQFFVCLSNDDSVQALDTLQGGYAAFGKVTEGMEVAESIEVGDALKSIEIVSESPHADDAREASKKARIE